jgi:predicted metal-binding protein
MEAVGIDVYKTARKAGFSINVVKEGQLYKSFILLLLE